MIQKQSLNMRLVFWLLLSEEPRLEVGKVYEVCNEVTPDTRAGLCCVGLRGLHLSGATSG